MDRIDEVDKVDGGGLVVEMLTPVQIERAWGVIRQGIRASLPATDRTDIDADMEFVYGQLLLGRFQCWAARSGTTTHALIVTCAKVADGTKIPALWIYAFFGEKIPPTLLKLCVEKLKEYARGFGGKRLQALTENPEIIAFVKTLGGSCDTVLVDLEV